jgi:hypothetical protein
VGAVRAHAVQIAAWRRIVRMQDWFVRVTPAMEAGIADHV